MQENIRGKILICDDSASIRMTLLNILNNANFEVFEVEDGEQAVSYYQDIKPDIVIMDIIMPKLNGIEALENIKKIDNNSKVIMCSSMCDTYTMNKALSKGALDFIIKPFSSKRVIEAVNKILN